MSNEKPRKSRNALECLPAHGKENRTLGRWVMRQRTCYKKKKLSEERMQRLEAVGFDWDTYGFAWEKMFEKLVEYRKANGDCNVPRRWSENPELGLWVSIQRTVKRSGKLSAERIRRLDTLGFVWDPKEKAWEESFAALVEYKNAHGDCNVPHGWKENPALGRWVRTQRENRKSRKFSAERTRRLDAIGFQWRLRG